MSVLFGECDDDVPPLLNGFDESLRCKICGDYFRAAVTIANTNCGHSFCSECIRNTFRQQLVTTKRQRRCPQCNYEVQNETRELVKNFALQEAVSAYKTTLPRILEALAPSSSADPRNSQTTPPSASSNALPIRSSGRHKPQPRGDDLAVDNYEDENKATNSSEMRAARVSMDSDIEFIEEGVKKKKPMANYAGKKKRQLIELCKQEDLRTDGTEEKLKKRHQDWILFYNAETDAIHPRSERELRHEFAKRETACAKASFGRTAKADSQAIVSLIHSRPKDDTEDPVSSARKLTSGNPAFDKMMNDNFMAMIEATRARQQRSKDTQDRTILQEEVSSMGSSDNKAPAMEAAPAQTAMTAPTVTVPSMPPLLPPMVPMVHERLRAVNKATIPRPQSIDLVCENDSSDKSSARAAALHSAPTHRPPQLFPTVAGNRRQSPVQGDMPPKRRRRIAIFGPWECPKCTYYNEKYVDSKAKCEMGCGGERPKPEDF